jgi:hypothetical protein
LEELLEVAIRANNNLEDLDFSDYNTDQITELADAAASAVESLWKLTLLLSRTACRQQQITVNEDSSAASASGSGFALALAVRLSRA